MYKYRGIKKYSDDELVFNNKRIKGGKTIEKQDFINILANIGDLTRFENNVLQLAGEIETLKIKVKKDKEIAEREELKRLLEKYKD